MNGVWYRRLVRNQAYSDEGDGACLVPIGLKDERGGDGESSREGMTAKRARVLEGDPKEVRLL